MQSEHLPVAVRRIWLPKAYQRPMSVLSVKRMTTIDPAKCPGVPKSLTLGLTGRDRGRIAGDEPELFMPGSTSYKREHVLERKIEAGKSFAVLAQGNVVYYPHGRYELRGDGVYTAYQWVWIPSAAAVPAVPPPPPLQ